MTLTADVTSDAAAVTTASPEPRWARPGLLALLTATAVQYLWGLGSSGWANSYYAAAAQAGTQSWKAWLFGSLDAGNAITVDKPPAAMWVMSLSGRLFGFNAFTMLLPQALMGVAAVAVLYFTVRRCSGPGAGLIAGVALAVTPVAVLMFRYNNPDALLVLLLVVAAYFTVRAIETGGIRWMALTGCVIGFAFLTKMLQAFLIVPGLAVAFLVAAPIGLWKRVGALLVGGVTMIVSAGWYIALVSLWPANSRPYIAGSTDNSVLQLALGYNGLQRITGGEGGPGGGHGPSGGGPAGANLFFGGEPGITRMFGSSFGAEASWLLPAALIGLAAMGLPWRAARTDRLRANVLLWGGWLLVTGAVFSFMDGTVHPYYTVALAPAVAALVGISVVELWRRRSTSWARGTLTVMLAATGGWAFMLLRRTPDWLPALRWVVLVACLVVGVVLVVGVHRWRRVAVAVVIAAVVFGFAGSTAFAVYNTTQSHSGPGTMSGPVKAGGFGGFGPEGPGGRGPGGPRGANAELQELVFGLDNRWAAAGIGSMEVSDLELKTGASLMAIGGFTGGDPSPTLAQFQKYVADGQVRYLIISDRGGRGPSGMRGDRDGVAKGITTWVEQHFTKRDVGGTTVYDLQSPRS
jgi:4-amino-4-deoxy-L-arabinose transferase-like glycosyltransferase